MNPAKIRDIEGFDNVYLLADDAVRIGNIQKATLGTADYGLALDHGLLGSNDWWNAIERDTLPLHTDYGTVSCVTMTGMGDYPSFKILADDGTVTDWLTREAAPRKDQLYQIGLRVIHKYVDMRPKNPSISISPTHHVTVGIWLAKTVTLYRPVGAAELRLIADSGYAAFPPRLPGQPIFYPVLTERYAAEIASGWNVKESGVGYVTRFAVDKAYLDRYEVQQVGNESHREYWIAAEDLVEFNHHLVGKIEIVRSYPEA